MFIFFLYIKILVSLTLVALSYCAHVHVSWYINEDKMVKYLWWRVKHALMFKINSGPQKREYETGRKCTFIHGAYPILGFC